jgi:hypothetical protein
MAYNQPNQYGQPQYGYAPQPYGVPQQQQGYYPPQQQYQPPPPAYAPQPVYMPQPVIYQPAPQPVVVMQPSQPVIVSGHSSHNDYVPLISSSPVEYGDDGQVRKKCCGKTIDATTKERISCATLCMLPLRLLAFGNNLTIAFFSLFLMFTAPK